MCRRETTPLEIDVQIGMKALEDTLRTLQLERTHLKRHETPPHTSKSETVEDGSRTLSIVFLTSSETVWKLETRDTRVSRTLSARARTFRIPLNFESEPDRCVGCVCEDFFSSRAQTSAVSVEFPQNTLHRGQTSRRLETRRVRGSSFRSTLSIVTKYISETGNKTLSRYELHKRRAQLAYWN